MSCYRQSFLNSEHILESKKFREDLQRIEYKPNVEKKIFLN